MIQNNITTISTSQACKYLHITLEAFKRYIKEFNINPVKIKNKDHYVLDDIYKIQSDLEERKRICSLPNHKSIARSEWKPTPRDDYYNLEEIGNLLNISKQHAGNIMRKTKIKLYKDNWNTYYFSKTDINNMIEELNRKKRKNGIQKKSN